MSGRIHLLSPAVSALEEESAVHALTPSRLLTSLSA